MRAVIVSLLLLSFLGFSGVAEAQGETEPNQITGEAEFLTAKELKDLSHLMNAELERQQSVAEGTTVPPIYRTCSCYSWPGVRGGDSIPERFCNLVCDTKRRYGIPLPYRPWITQ